MHTCAAALPVSASLKPQDRETALTLPTSSKSYTACKASCTRIEPVYIHLKLFTQYGQQRKVECGLWSEP